MPKDNRTEACLKSKRNREQMLENHFFFFYFECEHKPSDYWQNSGTYQKQLAAWPETEWNPQLPFTSFPAQARHLRGQDMAFPLDGWAPHFLFALAFKALALLLLTHHLPYPFSLIPLTPTNYVSLVGAHTHVRARSLA